MYVKEENLIMDSASSIEQNINKIVDKNADQARFFLGLSQKDSDTLIDEINNTKNVSIKVSMILRLLVDRLASYQKYGSDISCISSDTNPDSKEIFLKRTEAYKETLYNRYSKCFDQQESDVGKKICSNKERLDVNKCDDDMNKETVNIKSKYTRLKRKYFNVRKSYDQNKVEIQTLKKKINKFSLIIKDLRKESTLSIDLQSVNYPSSSDGNNGNALISSESEISGQFSTESSHDQNLIEELRLGNLKIKNLINEVEKLKNENQQYKRQKAFSFAESQIFDRLKQCEANESRLSSLEQENSQLKTSYNGLFNTVSVLRAEITTLNEEKKKLIDQVSCSKTAKGDYDLNVIEKDAYMLRYQDVHLLHQNATKSLNEANEEVKRLNRECIRLESQATRMKDEIYKYQERMKYYENECLTLSRFGFLLADALGSSFNPENVEIEIERLIEIINEDTTRCNQLNNSPKNSDGYHIPHICSPIYCSLCGKPL